MSSSEQKSSSEAEEVDEKPVQSAQKKKNKRKSDKKKSAPAPQAKKAKVDSPKTPAIAPKGSSDESDSDSSETTANAPKGTILDLGRDCHVRINDFKGKTYLDIRGYYKPQGAKEMKPGNKGYSFTPEQWAVLKKNIPLLDKALQKATKG